MSGLEFDERVVEALEFVYTTRDVLRRRALVREALAPEPGERILDVGCGPGFYVAELLDEVGPEGAVVGVDASDASLAMAARRCGAATTPPSSRPTPPRSQWATGSSTRRSACR